MRAVSPIRHRRPLCQLGRAPPLCAPLCRPSPSPPPTPLADLDAAACGSTVLPAGSRRPSSAHNSGGGNWSGRSPETPALDVGDGAPSDPGDDSSISRSATPARNNPERRDPSSIDQRGTNRTRATEGYGRAGGIVRAAGSSPAHAGSRRYGVLPQVRARTPRSLRQASAVASPDPTGLRRGLPIGCGGRRADTAEQRMKL